MRKINGTESSREVSEEDNEISASIGVPFALLEEDRVAIDKLSILISNRICHDNETERHVPEFLEVALFLGHGSRLNSQQYHTAMLAHGGVVSSHCVRSLDFLINMYSGLELSPSAQATKSSHPLF